MRLYTVQCRAGGPAGDPDVVLIKEGFCWPALFIPLLWALYHRLWWGVAAYIAVAGVLGAAVELAGLAEPVQTVVMFGLALLVGWSANDWRRWTLDRAGYRSCGVIMGRRLIEAEARLFDGWNADPLAKPRELRPAPDAFQSGLAVS
jgi:hypothetical protein